MDRNRRDDKYLLTRARYKSIKAFDHRQMEQFCTDIYKSGYQDGQESVHGVGIEAIMGAIGSVKGIGAKKLEGIRASIEAVFEGGGQDADKGRL